MIEELKPYEALRPSYDPWLGEIPKHWSQKRLWSISSPRVERNPGNLPLLSVFLDRGVIPYGEGGGQVHAPSLDLSNYQVVHPGDFVLNNQQAWRGSVGVSRHHGIISPAYIVLRLNGELLPAYANYLFRCLRLVDQFVAASKGVGDIQRQVFWPFLRRVTVPIPSTMEQEAIGRFLDHANRHIDQFIRAKKKLIALLNEQKQAIIHQAVTRGLDPNVKLKDSGVPWLRQIPAHWEIAKLKHNISTIEQGWSPQCDAQPVQTFDEWAVLKVGCVNRDVFSPHQNKKLPLSLQPRPQLVVRMGDVLMSRANTPSLVGLAALVEQPYPRLMISDKHYRFRGRPDRVDEQFLVLALRSSPTRAQIESATNGASSSMQNISQQLVGNLLVALPGLDEQRLIRAEVASSTAGLRRVIASTEAGLAFVSEYRTRLISDVVTGQLNVRAAALLPDVEEELAPAEPSGDEDGDLDDHEAA